MKKIFSLLTIFIFSINCMFFIEIMAEKPESLKVSFVGETGVGKTSIAKRLIKDTYSNDSTSATIGAAFANFIIKDDDGVEHNLVLWDTAGQEFYKSLVPMYVRNTDIAIVVFSLNDENSLKKVQYFKEMITNSNNDKLKMIIVANKLDLVDDINYDYLKQQVVTNDEPLLIISAANSSGFADLKKQILSYVQEIEKIKSEFSSVNLDVIETKKKCC